VTAHQAAHPVATMCRVLGVSPSGYYAWRKRPLSTRARTNVELTAHIEGIHRLSRGTYGAPRIHAELAAGGGAGGADPSKLTLGSLHRGVRTAMPWGKRIEPFLGRSRRET